MPRIALCLLLLITAPAWAEMRIIDISGASGAVVLTRYGQQVPIEPFADLQVDDELRVLEPDAYVIIGGGVGEIRVGQGNSPYRIREVGRPSVFDNAISHAVEMYRRAVGKAEDVISVITRGDARAAPELRCMSAGEILVPEGLPIRVFWTNGRGPFSLTLRGPEVEPGDGTSTFEAEASPALVAPEGLAAGLYRIAITDAAGVRARFPATIRVVPGDALPGQVRQIIGSDLPQRARHRLAAARLEAEGPWQYAAVLYASEAEDDALLAGLLARACR